MESRGAAEVGVVSRRAWLSGGCVVGGKRVRSYCERWQRKAGGRKRCGYWPCVCVAV